MNTNFSTIIAVVVYALLLVMNRKNLIGKTNRPYFIVLNIYLLTLGLVVSPLINAIIILMMLLLATLQKRRIERDTIIIISIIILYVIFNTLVIYSTKGYSKDFNPYIGAIELATYNFYIISLKMVEYDEKEESLLIETTSLFSVGVFLVGIIELTSSGAFSRWRIYSIFRNPNLVGIYGLIIFALVFRKSNPILSKHYKNLVIVCSFLLVLFSQSRVAWLGLAIYFVCVISKSNLANKFKYILGIACIAIIFIVMFRDQITYVYEMRILTAINREDFSTSDRIALLKAALDIFKDHWAFGSGIRSFSEEARNYGYSFWSAHVTHPHNAYLELLQTLGITGFVLYAGLIIRLVNKRRRSISNYKATFISLLFVGLLNRLFNEYSTTIFFWTIIVMMSINSNRTSFYEVNNGK